MSLREIVSGWLLKLISRFGARFEVFSSKFESSISRYIGPLLTRPSRAVAHSSLGLLALVILTVSTANLGIVHGGADSSFLALNQTANVSKEDVRASLAYVTAQPALPDVIHETYEKKNNLLALAGNGVLANNSPVATEGEGWKVEIIRHRVSSGDTLSGIANKYKVTTESLYWMNGLKNADMLRIGQIVKVPPVSGLTHTVKSGETINGIAKKYDAERMDIINYNDLGGSLKPGMKLLIPGASKSIPRPKLSAPSFYAYGRYGSSVPSYGGGNFIYPTRCCGYNGYHWWAIDIPGSYGQSIWAADSGRIVTAKYGYNGGLGNYIVIEHGNGFRTLYAHNSSLAITGGYVKRGQVIAHMGCTGRTWGRNGCGIHLHFEIHKNGARQNPLWYL